MDRTTRAWILCILATSLALNVWGISFGLPDAWHPDEIVHRSAVMARNFSLNPHDFRYGSLHFYQILSTMLPAYLVTKLLYVDVATQKTAVYLAGRALSAALGTGCVALVFCMARRLFSVAAGLISAAFLALTMGFVNISHYATVDVPMLFWMLVSFLMATHVLHGGGRRSYLLAGVFAGLAASTKYPAGVILLSLLAAHFLREGQRDPRALLYGVVASAITFILANPPMLLSSCEFFESFIENAGWHEAEGDRRGPVAFLVISDIYHAAGPALGILMPLSLLYAVVLIYRRTYARETLLLFSMLVPYFILLLGREISIMRYVVPVIPPLTVIMAKMMSDLMLSRQIVFRCLGASFTVVAVVISGAYTIAADLEMTNDSRKVAAAWIDRNVPEGSTIETTLASVSRGGDRGGVLSKRFNIVMRPKIYSDRLGRWVERIDETRIYRILYPTFLAYASFAEAAGLCDGQRPYFEGWYQGQLVKQQESLATFDQTINGLEDRAPDFVVISSLWLNVDGATPEGQFFLDLFGGKSAYRQVAEIHYSALPFSWLDPQPEFVNPKIYIFRRANTLGLDRQDRRASDDRPGS